MEDHKIVQRNIALQREWYGEPLGDRVRRLVVAFDVSQAYLAEVLGISAPMLSQVMSGRRAKIGNPVVLARMIMLERKCLIPEVAAGRREALLAALEDVKDARPTVGRDNIPVAAVADDRLALAALREVAEDEDLGEAAKVLHEDFPAIADLLRRAGLSEARDVAGLTGERRP
ncbi:helix-turn-helix domain-containing protein [Amycolatopsis acidiphila]|uniref:Helix-turn-helix transcriptional regulator n=1 Tax=Amycolatopsis acidiphila TaxID=715473 RepID=A0A557ZY33_9PSEU|nr:helix-turn-helix transcriptional regulator [Amycolatopsis acidiphila]TVT16929.1 helix-turn-helix transcriptional regulator [Amycolatopsis acidiphila]UIJ62098.1 helix-turn-helix domain-containing protein [Amycolatopsis acidiphila]GHG91872.1 DNA-binding protein [Amycolatopsis acidiphila]